MLPPNVKRSDAALRTGRKRFLGARPEPGPWQKSVPVTVEHVRSPLLGAGGDPRALPRRRRVPVLSVSHNPHVICAATRSRDWPDRRRRSRTRRTKGRDGVCARPTLLSVTLFLKLETELRLISALSSLRARACVCVWAYTRTRGGVRIVHVKITACN